MTTVSIVVRDSKSDGIPTLLSDIDPYNYKPQIYPGANGKRLTILSRSPMRTMQFTGSLDPTFRSSVGAVLTVGSETSSQTVVGAETRDRLHLTLHSGPVQMWGRQTSV